MEIRTKVQGEFNYNYKSRNILKQLYKTLVALPLEHDKQLWTMPGKVVFKTNEENVYFVNFWEVKVDE